MMKDLLDIWGQYYENNPDTALKDKIFFRMELGAIDKQFKKTINSKTNITVLELGCGTGLLAQFLIKNNPNKTIEYDGVDFSAKAIALAKKRRIENCHFIKDNFVNFLTDKKQHYDVIISQRAIMALLEAKKQSQLFTLIKWAKKADGAGIFSEATLGGYEKINYLRKQLNMPKFEKTWHCRPLKETELKQHFNQIAINDYSSSYWLITRVIYPYFIKQPKHNSPIAKFASQLKQKGNYSFVKLITVR